MPGAVEKEGAGIFTESEEWFNNQEMPGEPSCLQKGACSESELEQYGEARAVKRPPQARVGGSCTDSCGVPPARGG